MHVSFLGFLCALGVSAVRFCSEVMIKSAIPHEPSG
jgi:hypothetical protein